MPVAAATSLAADYARSRSDEDAGPCNGGLVVVEHSWMATMLSPIISSEAALSRVSPRDAAEMLWSIGRIGVRPPARIVHGLLFRFTRFVPRHPQAPVQRQWPASALPSPASSSSLSSRPPPAAICPQDVANVCWALAALQFQPHETLRDALMAQIEWVLQIRIQSRAEGAWGAQVREERDRARSGSRELGHAVPVILWAMTRLDGWAGREPVALALAARALSSSMQSPSAGPHLTPQGTSMVLYCFARSAYRPRRELVSLLLKRLPLGEPEEDPEEPPHTTDSSDDDAFLTMGKGRRRALCSGTGGGARSGKIGGDRSGLIGPVGLRCPEVSAQTAAVLLWSLGKLGFRPSDAWIRRLLVHTVHLLPTASTGEVCNLAKGLAMLR